ncbi:hypothetical protein BGX38DRAFT_1275853 [Terfezia claveryi]|nr:hypothetical protein BGX38DRAFT_1275853 [Terfezia claveryi]
MSDARGKKFTRRFGSVVERINSLATTRILTPADLAKLAELRTAAKLSKLTGGNKEKAPITTTVHTAIHEETVTSDIIAHTQAPGKASKSEKLAKRERIERSLKVEKQRKKDFLMTLASAKRRQKKERKAVRGHAAQKKRQGQKRK